MNGYFEQISAAADAVTILSPVTFAWFGARRRVVAPHLRNELPPQMQRRILLAALREQLYGAFYLHGAATPRRERFAPSSPSTRAAFVETLARANTGRGQWDDGWLVLASDPDGGLQVERDGVTLHVAHGGWQRSGPALPQAGTRVRLGPLRDDPAGAPGCFSVLGEQALPRDPALPLLRVYWNCRPAGAAMLVQHLSTRLNREEIPFRLKLVDDPARYTRADAAVLYVEPDQWELLAPVLVDIYPRVAADLRAAVPALTLELAPGLGLAEDPGGGESFGTQRCRLLAEGLLLAWEQRRRGLSARMLVVAEHFAEAGVSFDTPFLQPGSTRSYPFTLPVARRGRVSTGGVRPPLEIALELGRRISERAIWSGARCTWLGARAQEPADAGTSLTWQTLGPDLYDGVSGIGLILAELARHNGDPALHAAALGAARQAIALAADAAPTTQHGLYTGVLGAALACARIGRLLGDPALLSAAREMVASWDVTRPSHTFDLLSGTAGSLIALLALRRVLDAPELDEPARYLGERLCAAATVGPHGCSWGRPGTAHLTGLAHGASGAGLALLELWNVGGDGRFREVAQQAFAWERHWFDPQTGNWPDFREVRMRAGRMPRRVPQATFWCHGAPGIALSRVRAYHLTADPLLRADAAAALETTRRVLLQELRPATLNFSLCHGLAGLAAVHLEAAALLPQQDSAPAHFTAEIGTRLFATSDALWPCGTHSAETPGLLLGLAGIAWFYLRLHDPELPSVLLPSPAAFVG